VHVHPVHPLATPTLMATPAFTARPRIQGYCIRWCACLLPSFRFCQYSFCLPWRDGQAELTWVVVYVPRRCWCDYRTCKRSFLLNIIADTRPRAPAPEFAGAYNTCGGLLCTGWHKGYACSVVTASAPLSRLSGSSRGPLQTKYSDRLWHGDQVQPRRPTTA